MLPKCKSNLLLRVTRGVHSLFADDGASFVSSDTALHVLQALSTRDGNELECND